MENTHPQVCCVPQLQGPQLPTDTLHVATRVNVLKEKIRSHLHLTKNFQWLLTSGKTKSHLLAVACRALSGLTSMDMFHFKFHHFSHSQLHWCSSCCSSNMRSFGSRGSHICYSLYSECSSLIFLGLAPSHWVLSANDTRVKKPSMVTLPKITKQQCPASFNVTDLLRLPDLGHRWQWARPVQRNWDKV